MESKNIKQHESYGMINVSRFSGGNGQFFGSDITHNGGISIDIYSAESERFLSSNWYHSKNNLIRIEMSHNQFIDAIISGMNTSGVPCTIKSFDGKQIPQIEHIEDKKEVFSNNMKETLSKYNERIDNILEMLEGNVGKRKASEIKHELNVLKSHMSSNTNYVMDRFNEAMDKTVTEAKHSISNYIEHKIHTLGVEGLRNQLQISIDNNKLKE